MNIVNTISNIYSFGIFSLIQAKNLKLLYLRLFSGCCKFKENLIFQDVDLKVDTNLHILRACRSLNLRYFRVSILLSTKRCPQNNVSVYREFSLVLGGLESIYLIDLGLSPFYLMNLGLDSFVYWTWVHLLDELGPIISLVPFLFKGL